VHGALFFASQGSAVLLGDLVLLRRIIRPITWDFCRLFLPILPSDRKLERGLFHLTGRAAGCTISCMFMGKLPACFTIFACDRSRREEEGSLLHANLCLNFALMHFDENGQRP
jgi:hypothetical protein